MSIPSVLNATLARSANALLAGDFPAWSRSVLLPFTFVSRSETKQYHTWDELRTDFKTFVDLLERHCVSEIRRNVISIDHISPTHLIVRFSTEILSGSEDVIAPYTSTATLQFRKGAWQAHSIMGALGPDNWAEFAKKQTGNVIPLQSCRANQTRRA